MKTTKAFLVMLAVAALGLAPISAQRPGSHGGGGSRPGSSSVGGSRPSGGHSMGTSSRPSSSGVSRPSSSSRPGGSYSSPSKGGSSSFRSNGTTTRPSSRPSATSRPSSTTPTSRPGYSSRGTTKAGTPATTRPGGHVASARPGGTSAAPRPSSGAYYGNRPISGPVHAAPAGQPYARAGRPGPMPPAMRPMRPAPFFHHPVHGGMVHMHPIFWDPVPFHVHYWPGFWGYCHGYWHDYHVSDIVVVREYVRDNYHTDLVTYVMSDSLMYALTIGDDGDTYLQVFDKEDNLLAQQKVNKKYCLMEIDKENGGCWIMKKKNKDSLLFLYNDGELLIYEAD